MILFLTVGTPRGWKLKFGEPRVYYPDSLNTDEISDHLTEDMFYYSRDNVVIDIGWYPDGGADGKYVVQVVRDSEWADPVDLLTSRDPEEVSKFIHEMANKYMGS